MLAAAREVPSTTLQSRLKNVRTMVQTMINDRYDMPFLGTTGTIFAGHGRFASQLVWGGAGIKVRMIAPTVVGEFPGISVPIGRRLRS